MLLERTLSSHQSQLAVRALKRMQMQTVRTRECNTAALYSKPNIAQSSKTVTRCEATSPQIPNNALVRLHCSKERMQCEAVLPKVGAEHHCLHFYFHSLAYQSTTAYHLYNPHYFTFPLLRKGFFQVRRRELRSDENTTCFVQLTTHHLCNPL